MRTLEQIASENYIQHTSKDIEILEIVRSETVADLLVRLTTQSPALAKWLSEDFWKDNQRGR